MWVKLKGENVTGIKKMKINFPILQLNPYCNENLAFTKS